jgi:hypothetical protein
MADPSRLASRPRTGYFIFNFYFIPHSPDNFPSLPLSPPSTSSVNLRLFCPRHSMKLCSYRTPIPPEFHYELFHCTLCEEATIPYEKKFRYLWRRTVASFTCKIDKQTKKRTSILTPLALVWSGLTGAPSPLTPKYLQERR